MFRRGGVIWSRDGASVHVSRRVRFHLFVVCGYEGEGEWGSMERGERGVREFLDCANDG